ncbi:MAG: 3'-5' exonuclease [Burkholderiales bacterium]|nr:MAG: 3'-5' exonuclease [Burkholderiales bacterium]
MFDWLRKTSDSVQSERWIALDLETTGLDPTRDRIVEIGAIAIHLGDIVLHDYFHRVLSGSGTISAENRIVHGVTALEQYDGAALADALESLIAWVGDSPFVGFFTEFDVKFLRTAIASQTNKAAAKSFAANHIDVQRIAPALFPEVKAKSLGEWSKAMKSPIKKQHRALADALATAHLLQRILAKLPPERRTFSELQALEQVGRWS